MINHFVHNLSPEILSLGPLTVRWYGVMYLVGFTLAYFLLRHRYRRGLWALNPLQSQDLITYLLVGMLFGARFVYVLIYNPEIMNESFWNLFAVWQGGLSYHGATIGFSVAMYIYCKRNSVGFMHLADNVSIGAALGVFFGRIGNFINGELYGRVTDVPWAVIFPDGGPQPRHPSQLYQALGEGLLTFLILLLVQRFESRSGNAPTPGASGKEKLWKRTGVIASVYFILYGVSRFTVEFFREPDPQLGYYFGWMTMGQILCTLMVLIGTIVLVVRIKKPIPAQYEVK